MMVTSRTVIPELIRLLEFSRTANLCSMKVIVTGKNPPIDDLST